MIETIKDYREEIFKFKSKLGQKRETLFRGQSNHSWKIKSSLERHGIEIIECEEYYRIIDRYTIYLNEDALIKSLADEWALEDA
jgi:hypothetical protein